MKTFFIIVIVKQCKCGMGGCSETWFVKGETVVEGVLDAQRFETYPECEKMISELSSANKQLPDGLRMELIFNIEKFYV